MHSPPHTSNEPPAVKQGRSRRWRLAAGALAVGAVVATIGLLRTGGPSAPTATSKLLRVYIEKNPGSLDPVLGTTIEAHFTLNQVYERLVRHNSDGTLTGGLAASWSALPGTPGYDFELRPDARFSDGTPVQAKDVARTLLRIIRAGQIRHMNWIVGAEAYAAGRSEHVAGIEILGPQRIRVRLTRRDERFLRDLWNSQCSVMQEAREGAIPLGSGPYRISRYERTAGRIELARNSYYVGRLPDFDSVLISVEPGDYDLAFVQPPQNLSRYITTKYFDSEMYYLGFNVVNPRVASRKERQRLVSLLTDDLLQPFFPNRPYKVGGVIPLGIFGYAADLGLPPLPPLNELTAQVSSTELVLTSYQPMLRGLSTAYCTKLNALGTPCRILTTDVSGIDAAKRDNSLQAFFGRIKTTIPEAETALSTFTSGHPLNRFTSSKGSAIDQDIDRAMAAAADVPISQSELLLAKVRRVDQIINAEALVKPFAYGGEKQVWHLPGLRIPPLDLAGIVDMELRDVHWRE